MRKIDELGRVVLPLEVRKELGLPAGSGVEVTVENGRIILEPVPEHCCTVCHKEAESLYEISGIPSCGIRLCESCLEKLKWEKAGSSANNGTF